jgi:peptide deformylase
MAVLPLVLAPNPLLNQKSEDVSVVDKSIQKIMDDMLETMYYEDNAVGLSAVQVGILKNIFILDIQPDGSMPETREDSNPTFFVNLKILNKSKDTYIHKEGCLSFPDVYVDVERHEWVEVEYLDYHGKKQNLTAHDWLAIGIQHEYDHTIGITFADRVSKLKRDLLMRKLMKNLKKLVN